MDIVAPVREFLGTPTPAAWLAAAQCQPATLLVDHANCEKKAAGTALSLLYRYVDRGDLLDRLSRLAREELRHFEQVLVEMRRRDIAYHHLSPSRYAGELRRVVATHEPQRLVDTLIVGAVVEARSCERFALLVEADLHGLGTFYQRLLASEARHFEDYLNLAQRYSEAPIDDKVAQVLALEAELISAPDTEFRFHSGPPEDAMLG